MKESIFIRTERPVLNESQAVTVKFGLTLQQIMDVVSKDKMYKNGQLNFKCNKRDLWLTSDYIWVIESKCYNVNLIGIV